MSTTTQVATARPTSSSAVRLDPIKLKLPGDVVVGGAVVPNLAALTAINEKAAALAAALGKPTMLGLPTRIAKTSDGLGYYRRYEHGLVLWRSDRGAVAIYGLIRQKWGDTGGLKGFLGWPVADEADTVPTRDGVHGRYSYCDGGVVLFSPGTGAHEIHGSILALWVSLGNEAGLLGLPVSDEQDLPGYAGGRSNMFQHGQIDFTPEAGARVTRLDVQFDDTSSTSPGTIHIEGLGDGDNTPVPQVRRVLHVDAHMHITDDDWGFWDDDEHADADFHEDLAVDSWDPATTQPFHGVADEVRVEVAQTAQVRPDGTIRVFCNVKLFEGTDGTSTDLDGERNPKFIVPKDGVITVPIQILNDNEGGDHAEILITASNSAF